MLVQHPRQDKKKRRQFQFICLAGKDLLKIFFFVIIAFITFAKDFMPICFLSEDIFDAFKGIIPGLKLDVFKCNINNRVFSLMVLIFLSALPDICNYSEGTVPSGSILSRRVQSLTGY